MILTPLILILLVFFLAIFLLRREPAGIDKILAEQFGNNYKTQEETIDNFLVTLASSTIAPFSGETAQVNTKATPLVIIQDLKTGKIQSIFETSFINNGQEDKGNNISPVTFYTKNNQKGNIPLAVDFNIYYGGSGSLQGMAVFDVKNGKLEPVTGYPGTGDSLILTDKISNQKFKYPGIDSQDFVKIKDLNFDGISDLLLGTWEWKTDEAHYEARPWTLQVFEYKDNQFKVASWWNNGQKYTTPEKIGYNEEDKITLENILSTKLNK